MAAWIPGWLQGGTFTAQHDRINSRAAAFDEGILRRTALKVTQRGAGANLSVDVAIGGCIVTGDDQALQGNYDVFFDAVTNVTGFTAPGSNSRYDLVGVQINDPNAGGAAGSNAVLVRVAGTAAASPVIPALPNSFLPLAVIGPILTSTTSITNSMIHTAYSATGPAGTSAIGLCAGFRDTPGTTKETYNTVADNGWLMEFGQAVSRSTYADLFEHIGTTHGVGDGATTFNLPDSRGRVAVALDNMGGSDAGVLSSANVLGTKFGEELHTLTAAESGTAVHGHGVTDPGHIHSVPDAGSQQSGGNDDLTGGTGLAIPSNSDAATTGLTVNNHAGASASAAHNNMQPSISVNRMIRT